MCLCPPFTENRMELVGSSPDVDRDWTRISPKSLCFAESGVHSQEKVMFSEIA